MGDYGNSVLAGAAMSAFRAASSIADSYLMPVTKTPGLINGIVNSVLKSAGVETIAGVDMGNIGELRELIELQIQVQGQMQAISMLSNIEKDKHESRMAAIRNLRTT